MGQSTSSNLSSSTLSSNLSRSTLSRSTLSSNLIRDLSKGLLGDSDQSEIESNDVSIFEPDNSNNDFGYSGDNVK